MSYRSKEAAIDAFFNSFDVPAYEASTVPKNADFPYITYDAPDDSIDHPVLITVNVYSYSSSWREAIDLKDKIAKRLTEPGSINTLQFENGRIYLAPGSPFAQRLDDENEAIKRFYINIMAEYYSYY